MKKKILIAPLNWGLGHATRCIPIIKALDENGFEPIIASDGVALALLKKEFPNLCSNFSLEKDIIFELCKSCISSEYIESIFNILLFPQICKALHICGYVK